MDSDPCKFALTSRTGDVTETFILHSASPGVRQLWIHEINQILENQRNFLNGKLFSFTESSELDDFSLISFFLALKCFASCLFPELIQNSWGIRAAFLLQNRCLHLL